MIKCELELCTYSDMKIKVMVNKGKGRSDFPQCF